jgi:hypothetical protein
MHWILSFNIPRNRQNKNPLMKLAYFSDPKASNSPMPLDRRPTPRAGELGGVN